ncbi:MAG: thioredoxin [bacterium]|nr:thioredoxin [bacterium]
MEITLTDENFEKEIAGQTKAVLVDFYADWCEPCKMLGPILEKIAEEFKDKLVLAKANVNELPILSQKFGVEQIPTVVLFKDGKPIQGFLGLRSEGDIKKWLDSINI